jgi:hypothetical protein
MHVARGVDNIKNAVFWAVKLLQEIPVEFICVGYSSNKMKYTSM